MLGLRLGGALRSWCSGFGDACSTSTSLRAAWAASFFSTAPPAESSGSQPSTSTSSEPSAAEASTLAQKYLDPELMSRAKKLQQEKQTLIQAFQLSPDDVGSTPVQVALLTQRIRSLEQHFKLHRKDHHSLRGLQAMVQQRKRLLQYLRRSDFEAYSVVLHKLGLNDVYARNQRLDKYKIGTRLPFATQPVKLYKQPKKQGSRK